MNPRQRDWKFTAVLLLIGLIGLAPLTIGFFVEQPGRLVVIFRDPVFSTDLTGRKCVLSLDGKIVTGTLQRSREGGLGVFDLGLMDAAFHTVQWDVQGFSKGGRSVEVLPKRIQMESRLAVDLKPEFGRVEVQGLNAVTKENLTTRAVVRLGDGKGELKDGTVMFTDVPPGRHTVYLQADGYCEAERMIKVAAAETATTFVALSPSMNQKEVARIILDWKQAPDDLDAHLLINLAGEKTRHHVFYKAKQSDRNGRRVASLDVDMRVTGGFETITIEKGFKGRFVYVVHNYSEWDAMVHRRTLPPHMANAEPRVRLYLGDCNPRVFGVPESQTGLEWTVLEIEVDENGLVSVESAPQQTNWGLLRDLENR
jgi:hypothetical protein